MAELLSDFEAFIINVKIKIVTLSVRYTSRLFDTLRPFAGPILKKSQDEVTVEIQQLVPNEECKIERNMIGTGKEVGERKTRK